MATTERQQSFGKGRAAKIRAEANGNTTNLGRLAALLEKQGIDVSQVGEVRQVKLTEWQGFYKDDEGEAHVVDMEGQSIVISPSWDNGPKWPVVQPAKPVKVTAPTAKKRATVGTWRTAVFLPDPQIGYRRMTDGRLDPFHDARAIDVAMQLVEAERPDLVIWLGDVLDLAPMGKYRYEAGFAQTVQPALERAHELMAIVRELAGEVRFIEGNHDVRLQHYITDNALAAFGLKRAGAPSEWPVLSVPNLLRLDELGIEYVDGYPAGATYVNDNLAAVHGHKVNSAGSTAAAVIKDEQVSVVLGHVHRIETQWKTRNSRGAPRFTVVHSPGCLCRIDGAVPSVKGGVDSTGRPRRAWEDWQQGITVARYEAAGAQRFTLEPVPITEGFALHRGQEFTARKSLDETETP